VDLSVSAHILILLAHALIIIGSFIRIIMIRLPVGVSLAWLILIIILPFIGALLYLLFGEKHLGRKHAKRAESIIGRYAGWLNDLPPQVLTKRTGMSPGSEDLNRLTQMSLGILAMSGNALELIDTAAPILRSIIADIDRAKIFCHMEFYIFNQGGIADEVCEALVRAAGRGVSCRLLFDAMGSRRFLKGNMVRHLRDKGIQVAAALPIGPLRALTTRLDLRLHRKIVVIDNETAYTGSLNLVDPRFFKQEAGVGEWVDAMVKIRGPAVYLLSALFAWDWELESGSDPVALPDIKKLTAGTQPGTADVQVIPSGPGIYGDRIYHLLMMTMYAAREELVITTPYFVPDEAVFDALVSAARRGVRVIIILPQKNDSRMVHYTCHSYFDDLLDADVQIFGFTGGLLHTKSIVVDGEISLFGTVNMDIRSFWLDFEVTLCSYDPDFARRLRALQQKYIEDSEAVDPATWRNRPSRQRFLENMVRLASPLL
jgi:cardiolipin synthase A/B